MRVLSKLVTVVFAGTALMACLQEVSKAVVGPLPTERGAECRANCAALGMQLTSVVLILNSAGCVCQVLEATPPGSTRSATPLPAAGASAAAGGAAITAIFAAAQQQQHQQHEQHQQSYQPSQTHH